MALTLKKSLGQHFLHDENMCQKIVAQVDRHPDLKLLEIGPGGGAISKYLLKWDDTDYKAIEVDDEKVAYLPKAFPAFAGKLIHMDFLQAPVPFEGGFSIIGNFPYNISSQILFRILDWESQVDEVIGMFQKEVAQRVAAREGSKTYGILSVLIQAFFTTEYLFDVPPGCFTPPPKVMSGILKMTNSRNPYGIENKKAFVQIVKAAFNQRRKMLRNALKGIFLPEYLEQELFTKRAEQLSVIDFVGLYRDYIKQKA
ncbi:16S rRNA (adenine(1518)-N(6)/adenine(1519)-N(6))-dimethyltransferase RsmA [Taibaiella koreensis]|uniref:16S rRNA (adenine(1518)-N(6)/adenine(1519)-N(6))- dimethyltransferase RsmA n=1 Tax=Taibaiella koreensis TaxID=1268548 RepID=UPI000E59D772|nr:16S rRNA (adenine(1518)-N(6)/adenine(1519)-N(6))-dimethyltransferase RsmA [Taibaiella koreensis]